MTKQYNFTPAQDWTEYFDNIFKITEIEKILEFGLGLGTEFLCDNAKDVVSVELSTGDFNKEWADKTQEKLKEYKNWKLHYIDIPEEIHKSNTDAIQNQYPLEDTSYLSVLEKLINPFLNEKEYDIIFVDPGIHNRGDIVNLCFGNAKIIAAHDSDRTGRITPNIYGYNIVEVPENYTEIHLNESYMGTTFWVDHTLENSEFIINSLRK
jgi:predicted O-methyltransferase YrrM